MVDVVVRGANELETVARRLKDAGDGELRKELLAGIRKTNKPTITAIRARARAVLPHRGGLAGLVASSRIGTRTRLTAGRAGVEIRATGKTSISTINAGRVRHPVFGNRKVWTEQSVTAGWFDDPIEDDVTRIREGIDQAMADVANKIEK